MLDDTVGPTFRKKVDEARVLVPGAVSGRPHSSACDTQVYKLADQFTCTGSENAFHKLQTELETLAVRGPCLTRL